MQASHRQAAEAIVKELPSVVRADNEFGNIVSNLHLLDLGRNSIELLKIFLIF